MLARNAHMRTPPRCIPIQLLDHAVLAAKLRADEGAAIQAMEKARADVGTTWEHLRPNTRENEGAGPTRKQDESTRLTSQPCLQNLHPRFKSGRRLQNP
jgi:hypothetical protein